MGEKNFHSWVSTICAIIQAGAVVLGVVFAIMEIRHWQSDRDHDLQSATYALLSKLRQEPLNTVDQTLIKAKFLIVSGSITFDAFMVQMRPLQDLAAELSLCIRARQCQEDLAVAEFCPIYSHFLSTMDSFNPLNSEAQIGWIFVSRVFSSATFCPEDVERQASAVAAMRSMLKKERSPPQ